MKEFEKTRVLYGTLEAGSQKLENVRCEFSVNTVDTSTMKADLYDPQGTIGGQFLRDFMWKDVVFVSATNQELIQIEGSVWAGQLSGSSDKLGTITVKTYREDYYLNRDPVVEASFLYHVNDIMMFGRRKGKQLDSVRGLLIGWDFWSDPQSPKWMDETYRFMTDAGELVFYPGCAFADADDKTVLVRDQTMLHVDVKGSNIDIEGKKKEIDTTLESYLHVISFLENRFIDWFSCEIDARSAGGKGMVSTMFKHVPKRDYQVQCLTKYVYQNAPAYHKLLPLIVKGHAELQPAVKSELDKAIKQMLIGTQPKQSVEIKLIYWHSCLEILIKVISGDKIAERKNLGFSKKLVLACEDANIGWEDLYAYITKEKIFSEDKAFKITTLRNNMIHEGKYPDPEEYDDVFLEIARARALSERIIMKIIGLECQDTPVGKFRPYGT